MLNLHDLDELDSSVKANNLSEIPWNCDSPNATDCLWDSNSSRIANDSSQGLDPETEKVYWALMMIPLPLVAVVGNILVILSVYKERSLQTATNYFIVSLAFADLLVAAVVMPFAVYVLVNVDWELSETLCDFYIALDVTCSTASIFNLVAISIDRFIAVTQPIKYSKHKNHKRVFLTIAIVWLVSAAIGSPIVLGLNTSSERIPNLCIFYNSDFIIYSSLSSFYIPCIVMVYLYYKIFRAIHERAKKAIAKKAIGYKTPSKSPARCGLVIENTSQVDSMQSETDKDNNGFRNRLPPLKENEEAESAYHETAVETFINSNEEYEEGDEESSPLPVTGECQVIGNKAAGALPLNGSQNEDAVILSNCECDRQKVTGSCLEEETKFFVHNPHTESPANVAHDIDTRSKTNGTTSFGEGNKMPSESQALNPESSVAGNRFRVFETAMDKKKSRFSLIRHQKSSKKKKEKSAVRRERKATKTLAIVLGMFLMCWVPFFTCNILDAICIKLQSDTCRPGVTAFLLTTWLGYVNSCVNPVIYTIFNIEFRKAFKKLLLGPCK